MIQKTTQPRAGNTIRRWHLIDAEGQILGKVAVKAAVLLRGRHKRDFAPHADIGDEVVIINAEKIRVTGKKLTDKIYQKYSGYPSGQKRIPLKDLLAKSPEKVLQLAVHGMLPRGPLGNRMRRRLKIYRGAEHPHQAQNPQPVSLS